VVPQARALRSRAFDEAVGSRHSLAVAYLFGHRLGADPPDVLTVALSLPAQSVMDVLTAEGLGDLDLAAVAVPLWAIPSDQRSTVAGLCEYP